MKIISLEAENVKCLKAVYIEPDGSMIVVGGDNGQGKTSVLDSILYGLGGGGTLPGKPIREGEKEATITLDLGEYVVVRKITDKGTTLTIKNKDGSKFSSPQKMLDDLVGKLSFDPLQFSREKPGEQLETLKGFCDFDFAGNQAEKERVYSLRTDTNRTVKGFKAKAEGFKIHQGLPEEEVNPAELYDEIEKAKEHNADGESINTSLEACKERMGQLESDIKHANLELTEYEEMLKSEEAKLDSFKPIDIEPMVKQLHEAETTNIKIHENASHLKTLEDIKKFQEFSETQSKNIEELDKKKTEAVASANLPIEGLSFDGDGVSIKGIPFDQCSGAEQLRISLAVGIAMNPKLKVLLVKDGSLLDKKNLEMVAKMAEEAGAQVWIERVGKEGDPTVIIEDGAVLSEVTA